MMTGATLGGPSGRFGFRVHLRVGFNRLKIYPDPALAVPASDFFFKAAFLIPASATLLDECR